MRSQDKKLRTLIAEQAAEWHVAHEGGTTTPEQTREFMRWLRTSPVHVAEYLAIASVAQDVSEIVRESTASAQDVLAGDNNSVRVLRFTAADGTHADRVSPYRSNSRKVAPPRRAPRRLFLRWTAAFITLVVVSSFAWLGWHRIARRPTIATFATLHGQVRSVRLPDKTVMQLDSDSTVTIRFDRDGRRVELDRGQAYFKVAKDPGRPFSVRIGGALVRDVGTVFDVYRHDDATSITVAEGRVQVWSAPGHQPGAQHWSSWFGHDAKSHGTLMASLGPGQQLWITNAGQVTSLGKVDVQRTLAWTQGRVAFDNETIASVAAQFERYNNVQIKMKDPHIAAVQISGVFDTHDVPAFLAFLKTLPGVGIERRGPLIVVSARRQAHPRHD